MAAISGISPRLLDDVLKDISEFSDMFFCFFFFGIVESFQLMFFWYRVNETKEMKRRLEIERETSLFCCVFLFFKLLINVKILLIIGSVEMKLMQQGLKVLLFCWNLEFLEQRE
jgi:TRAP-type C4-dicarboxylate transport system permease large subunit